MFVDLIKRLDLESIEVFFGNLNETVKRESTLAAQIAGDLEKVIDTNSFWELRLYMANLGRHPILVQTAASLSVLDSTGAKLIEQCRLVLIQKDEVGAIKARRDATAPLVLGSADAQEFSFFTARTQGEMDRGDAFREAFQSGRAKCYLSFEVESVGLLRKRRLVTPTASFGLAATKKA